MQDRRNTRVHVGAQVTSLRAARAQFWLRPSPRWLAGGILLLLTLRIGLGGLPDWRDGVAVVAICTVYPFGEWAIHVYLLHLKPVTVAGRQVELPTAAAHRSHHEAPHNLDMVLLAPVEAVLLLGLALPLVIGLLTAPIGLMAGWPPLHAVLSAWAAGALLVLTYEWCHFLIHTAHQPRSRHFRAIHRQHRLHHFKNEHYWHGITTLVGDRVFGTNPDQRDVPRSATARSLRAG